MCPVFIVWGKMVLQVYLRLAVKVCRQIIICQSYITSAAQPPSIFQPQLPQTASHSMHSVFGVGQDMCHMQQVQHDQHGSDPISSLIASLQNLPTSQDIYAGQMVNTRRNLQTLVPEISQKDLDSSLWV